MEEHRTEARPINFSEVFNWEPIPIEQQYREILLGIQRENYNTQYLGISSSEVKMTYIREREKVKKKIEEVLKNNSETLKWSYVEKVKIRNRFTKEDQIIKDLYFIATDDSANKPLCVMAIQDNSGIYILHDDVTHWNMNSSYHSFTLRDGKRIYYRDFCNTVLMTHIWNNPDHASKFLVGTLSEGNPNDRYRTPNSVEVDTCAPPVISCNGQFMNNKCTLTQIITSYFDTSYLTRDQKIYIKSIADILKEKNKVYAFCAKYDSFPANYSWEVIDKSEIGKKYILSKYYKTYTIDDIDDIGEIPREEIDVCCVGCGSAGSNIMSQLARTEYMGSCLLIDFDRVEEKNLRNQTYTRNQLGMSKCQALANRIQNMKSINARYKNSRYEDIDFSTYKFKYIISGFDSIECRLGLLELIKNKTIETKYLIDTRYDELNSSLYIVDTSQEIELEYYEKLLRADGEELENKENNKEEVTSWTLEEAEEWAQSNAIHGSCRTAARRIGLDSGEDGRICDYMHYAPDACCGSDMCINCIREALVQQKVKHVIEENSCQHVNIIQIYKLTSAWVLSVIRGIETDEKKPVTHVEITADPIPNAVVIKK